jgi:hypothetical protein
LCANRHSNGHREPRDATTPSAVAVVEVRVPFAGLAAACHRAVVRSDGSLGEDTHRDITKGRDGRPFDKRVRGEDRGVQLVVGWDVVPRAAALVREPPAIEFVQRVLKLSGGRFERCVRFDSVEEGDDRLRSDRRSQQLWKGGMRSHGHGGRSQCGMQHTQGGLERGMLR